MEAKAEAEAEAEASEAAPSFKPLLHPCCLRTTAIGVDLSNLFQHDEVRRTFLNVIVEKITRVIVGISTWETRDPVMDHVFKRGQVPL